MRDTSCATCHTEGDLVAHQEAPPPPSHAAPTWGDPGNDHCGSCHLPLRDTECAVCHTDLDGHERPPQSHTPSFTSRPTYGHCDSCHFPVADEETCSVCHRNDDHRTSPEMPDWHDTISDCLYCHPASDPVPHQLTDQETCLRCHELQ